MNASSTTLLNTITNNGTIAQNSTGSFTDLHISGAVTLTGTGSLQMSNSPNNRVFGFGSDSLLNDVNHTIQGAGQLGINNAGFGFTLTNKGIINANQSGGTLQVAPSNTVTNNGTLEATNGGTLALTGGTFMNHGMMLADNGSTIHISNGPFTTDGTVKINSSGNLISDIAYTQTGGTTQVDGTLTANAGMDVSGGVLDGTGTIIGDVLLSGGTMEPGDAPASGTLAIIGNYDQTGGIFDELIGSAANGLLTVSGLATLGSGGDLNIDLLGGFTPTFGETFTIMEFVLGSGTFANAPPGNFTMDGFKWFIAYDPHDVVLTFESSGGPPPVPEPSSYILLATAAIALIGGGKLRAKG